jgi:SAM-dependent methyltransferase
LIYKENTDFTYKIYSSTFTKVAKKSFKELANISTVYNSVYTYLKDKPPLKILEVGCGLGYTSYAMAKAGHKVTGIDISSNAINNAKENFKDPNLEYICSSLENYNTNQKFDLIVTTEVFEHAPSPMEFIKILKTFLKDDGKMLVTTPSKDFCDSTKKDFVWDLEMPPVHTCMATSSGVEKISKQLDLKVEFINVNSQLGYRETPLINILTIKTGFLNKSKIATDSISNQKVNPLVNLPFYLVLWYKQFKSLPIIRNIYHYLDKLTYKLFKTKGNLTMVFILEK